MTVEELILKLQEFPQDAKVIQQDSCFEFEPKPKYDEDINIVYL
jgi:hypothetical protein